MGGERRVRGDAGGGVVGGAVSAGVRVDSPIEAEAVAGYIKGS